MKMLRFDPSMTVIMTSIMMSLALPNVGAGFYFVDWNRSLCLREGRGPIPYAGRDKYDWEEAYGSLQQCCTMALFWKVEECLRIGTSTPTPTPVTYPVPSPSLLSTISTPSAAPTPKLPRPTLKKKVIQPMEDTFVNRKRPNKTYGEGEILKVESNKIALLKFHVIPADGKKIMSAILSVYSVRGADRGGKVVALQPTASAVFSGKEEWDENGMSWNYFRNIFSGPLDDSTVLGEIKSIRAGQWYDIDVTAAAKKSSRGSAIVTLVIRFDGHKAWYSSKNGGDEYSPVLTITYCN